MYMYSEQNTTQQENTGKNNKNELKTQDKDFHVIIGT